MQHTDASLQAPHADCHSRSSTPHRYPRHVRICGLIFTHFFFLLSCGSRPTDLTYLQKAHIRHVGFQETANRCAARYLSQLEARHTCYRVAHW